MPKGTDLFDNFWQNMEKAFTISIECDIVIAIYLAFYAD